MVKKINNDALVTNKPITEKKNKKKLSQFYIDKIINLAKNKPINSMSCRRITYIMNSIFNKIRIKLNGK